VIRSAAACAAVVVDASSDPGKQRNGDRSGSSEPDSKGKINEFLSEFRKKLGGDQFENLKQLGEKIKCKDEKQKVKHLTIGAHANATAIGAGSAVSGPMTEDLNILKSNSGTWLPFFDRSRFCKDCEIWLVA
jgi:hypothetical protein